MKRTHIMTYLATILLAMVFCLPTNAQQAKQSVPPPDSTSTKLFCDPYIVQPEFPGGPKALMQYIHDHLRWPKKTSCTTKARIRVIIVCTIDEKGRVRNVKVMRSFSPEFDKEAIRVVKKLPKWTPGQQNGKICKARYAIPVVFKKEWPASSAYSASPTRR